MRISGLMIWSEAFVSMLCIRSFYVLSSAKHLRTIIHKCMLFVCTLSIQHLSSLRFKSAQYIVSIFLLLFFVFESKVMGQIHTRKKPKEQSPNHRRKSNRKEMMNDMPCRKKNNVHILVADRRIWMIVIHFYKIIASGPINWSEIQMLLFH